jgi:hypothetical protein
MRKLVTAALIAVLPLLLLAAAAPASGAARARQGSGGKGIGWVRLAHLAPNTPVADVYLYPFGDPAARKVLHGVGFGVVSPYIQLASGEYTIAIREKGTKASSPPVVSTAVWVDGGMMYTVAGIGEAKQTRLAVLDDTFKATPGRSQIRVLDAASGQVSVQVGRATAGRNLGFGHVTSYQTVAPGTGRVVVSSHAERAVRTLSLPPGSVHTIVVLDSGSGLAITDLIDAVGVSAVPRGGAATGLGGTAPRPRPPLPWLVMIVAGAGLVLAGLRHRPGRHLAGPAHRHARPAK